MAWTSPLTMQQATRTCYAGWHLSPEGVAYDFQGLCSPGELPSQQSSRTCQVPYYRHAAGTNVFYDASGYCDPAKTQQSGAGDAGGIMGSIGNLLIWGGIAYGAYYLWTNRSKIFGSGGSAPAQAAA